MDNKKIDGKSNIIVIGMIVLFIAVIGALIILGANGNKDSQKKKKKNMTSEEKIEEGYGFSKEDAINLVKKNFDGDIYHFEAEARADATYVVTVTNTLTKHKYIFYVNPATKTYRIDEKTM